MKRFIEQLWSSKFVRHNTVFFTGSVAVGGLNYLYYPILGRLLQPAAFGEVQALVSLFLQICIFLAVSEVVIVNIVANYKDEARRNAVILEFQKVGFYFSGALFIVALLFGRQLQHFFQFSSPVPFVLLGVALVANVPFTFGGAYLQGHQRFATFSAANLLAAGSKLLLSVLLIALFGWGTSGAIGGLALSQAIASVFVVWWALRLGLRRDVSQRRSAKLNLGLLAPELKFGAVVLLGSLFLTMQYSMDTLVVKHYFDAHTAGLYAGVASVARIVFFVTASISQVLIPMVRIGQAPQRNRQLLLRSLLLMFAVGVPLLGLFVVVPKLILDTLMGTKFGSVAHLLPLLSITIFVVSIANLFVAYCLALRRLPVAGVVLLGAMLTYVLMVLHHDTLAAVISNMLVGSISMVVALGLWLLLSPQGQAKGEVWTSN